MHADRIELVVTLARSSALRLIDPAQTLPPITPDNFADYEARLKAAGPQVFHVAVGDELLQPSAVKPGVSGDEDVTFHLTFPLPTDAQSPLRFFGNYLRYLVDNHVGTLVVMNAAGKDLGWTPITLEQPFFELPLPSRPPAATAEHSAGTAKSHAIASPEPIRPGVATFIKLGIEHILIGYDHLLFLLGLLIACRRFKTMIGIITCFTVAHSITLGLAAFDLVSLPPEVVEPLIAASIVFVGLENLLYRGEEPRHRWALTFVFGLVHGFGFAGVLREIGSGLSGRALAAPLFGFNLGVELGQLALAAVALPVLLWLRRRPAFALHGPRIVSSLVTLAGGYWLLTRTVLS